MKRDGERKLDSSQKNHVDSVRHQPSPCLSQCYILAKVSVYEITINTSVEETADRDE